MSITDVIKDTVALAQTITNVFGEFNDDDADYITQRLESKYKSDVVLDIIHDNELNFVIGIIRDDALKLKPESMSESEYTRRLNLYCSSTRPTKDGVRNTVYKLKSEYITMCDDENLSKTPVHVINK